MAGVKGKSGGPRPNAGGRRPGAGRPKGSGKKSANATTAAAGVTVTLEPQAGGGALKRSKAKAKTKDLAPIIPPGERCDPLTFLELVLNDPAAPLKDRIRAAVAAAQYRHTKLHDGGKKDSTTGTAKQAAGGRFAPGAPPKLVAAGGKKV